ncbi:C2H2 zinc finger protein [Cucurbitaria berberidis CBS 394.84]|uniref:C2H2 zinc finger protein n=1 Tax=Cucurbitaria berberidis CBS 394.84 TaxID=1168544 RepID=A0A9P4GAQ2_9PLEO|nr:C2H2 zinc finger protein [Cucurbitaria berberidis CBS 394.84]KAF1842101.1 C2H2 zinc finger protein [Cucurbitaria berberidis CBS 394.84]
MGNTQGKESQPSSRGHARRSSSHVPTSPTTSAPVAAPQERTGGGVYSSRNGRGSRHDLSFLGIRAEPTERDPALEPRRETKAEREARKLEKDRALRAQERERSIRDEGVDGGYLVTLGVYTGPEDFSKPIVRQLQIERRLAPFWKGLNDHEDTWTENQLVAVVNGLPLPAPDEIPPEEPSRASNRLSPAWNPRSSEPNLSNLSVPITSRSMSANSDRSGNLSPSHPAFSLPSPVSPISSASPFFRGRAKTLASLASGSRNASQTDIAPQELNLPKDPYVNGQRLEAFLYKNAAECPICFMYYPPHLNKTRCCDQPICSECFVQIKRPDPHPPEHHGEAESPSAEPQEEIQLVSEPAACPFCVQPEFGVTFEPPPFRRGLVYNGPGQNPLSNAASAMSSTTSLNSPTVTSPGRRRATSLAVNDKTVITTDMVRPDWAKKLADAKAHALRRAAAATALHNAAYMMGNIQQQESRFGLGRRRRTIFNSDSAGSSGIGTPRREGEGSSGRATDGSNDLFPGRISSRRGNRMDDLEELMMMEAIRLSLAAEEDRKRKEDKEAAKEAKKEGKKKAKENKKVAKAQRSIGSGFHPVEIDDLEDTDVGTSAAAGKGKAVDRSGGPTGSNSMTEPPSVINASTLKDDPQKHLEDSRAQIQRGKTPDSGNLAPFDPFSDQPCHRSAMNNLSNASSSASSFAESYQNSLRQDSQNNLAPGSAYGPSPNASGVSFSQGETPPQDTPDTEPMFNFQSLAEAITPEDSKDGGAQFIENVEEKKSHPSKTAPLASDTAASISTANTDRSEPLGESVMTLKPTATPLALTVTNEDQDEITAAPRVEVVPHDHSFDQKQYGNVSMVDRISHHQATQ